MLSSARSRISTGFLLFAIIALAANLRTPIVAVGPGVGFSREDLGVSGSFIGLVAALPMLAFALFSPLVARLARRFGMENVLVGSIVLLVAGMILRSVLPSAVLLLAGTMVIGAAIAMGNVLLPALAKRSLPTRVGLVVGAVSATMSVSSMVAAAVAVPLAQWQNWRWSLGIWALLGLVALAAWLRIRAQGVVSAADEPQAVAGGLNVWRSRAAWCISLFMGIQSVMFYSIVNFLPSVLVEKGMTPLAAGGYSSLLQAASLAGVLAVSARFGRSTHKQRFCLLASLLLLAGVAGVWLGTPGQMWLWVSLIGIGGSGVFSIVLMLFVLRTQSINESASLSGMAQSVGYLIAVLGPLGMGVLYDHLGSWSDAMAVLVALMLVECVLAWFAASPKTLAQSKAG